MVFYTFTCLICDVVKSWFDGGGRRHFAKASLSAKKHAFYNLNQLCVAERKDIKKRERVLTS